MTSAEQDSLRIYEFALTVATPRNQLEQDLLNLLQTEQKRNASTTQGSLPDLPPELFGGEAPKQVRQASTPNSPDAYLDFLQPPSPGRNVAEIGLDALWERPPALPVETAEDPLASLWSTPAPQAPVQAAIPGAPNLEALWDTAPGAEPDLEGLWDAPGRPTRASDDGDALSSLFMNGDALAQAEMIGVSIEAGDIPMPSRVASHTQEFSIEFDADLNFGEVAPPRTGRFRIDRPLPRSSFRGEVTAQDGVVVGQRGSDGRFRTAAVRQVAPAAVSPRAPQPPQRTVETPRPSTYDVLRKGGLDL